MDKSVFYDEVCDELGDLLGIDRSDSQGIVDSQSVLFNKCFRNEISVKETAKLIDKASRRD